MALESFPKIPDRIWKSESKSKSDTEKECKHTTALPGPFGMQGEITTTDRILVVLDVIASWLILMSAWEENSWIPYNLIYISKIPT